MTPEELRDKIIPVIDGCNCDECRRDALRAIKRFRKQALEEAAKVAEAVGSDLDPQYADHIADAIRALKGSS